MKISTNSRYALRFLARLSMMSEGRRVTTMEIATAEQLSEKMLERIASKLQRNGYIISAKGCAGGYMLAKDPGEIRVSDILVLMETNFLPIHCNDDPESCLRHEDCIFAAMFDKLNHTILAVTSDITLADILTGQLDLQISAAGN